MNAKQTICIAVATRKFFKDKDIWAFFTFFFYIERCTSILTMESNSMPVYPGGAGIDEIDGECFPQK